MSKGLHGSVLYPGTVHTLKRRPAIARKSSPCQDASIPGHLDNLVLQALERTSTFSIQSRHVDIEKAQEAVRLILDSRRPACGGPPHPCRDAGLGAWQLMPQDDWPDTRNLIDEIRQVSFVSQPSPISRDEDDDLRRDELLQRPSSRVPSSLSKRRVTSAKVAVRRDVIEVRKADLGI